MFADDTNLFYEHKDLKTFFSLVNQKLQKINEWFEANKLSLNVGKTKYSLFHKPSRKDDLPLLLPRLLIKKHKVARVKSIKFLGVLLDENLGKIILNILKIKSPKTLVCYAGPNYFQIKTRYLHYYSYLHTYLSYANLSWGSKNRTNLKSYSVIKSTQYELSTIEQP